MTLLLDTHVLIWAAQNPARLSPAAHDALVDPSATVLVSAASAWEISIKRGQGRLTFPTVTRELLTRMRMAPLPITLMHAAEVRLLPDLHTDPFDRMLVAQARVEGSVLVSRDPQVRAYDVRTLWD